jgi:hypothetical protein
MHNCVTRRARRRRISGPPTERLTAGTPPMRSLSGATWAPSGRLRVRKVGRRTIVTSDDADEWLSNLPALHGELDEAAP